MSKKHTSEHLHSNFCKQTLGIDRFTPDLTAKAELGRFLLMGAMIKQTYSFWQHLLSSNDTSLSYKALQFNINGYRRGQDTYCSRIKCLLAVLDERNNIFSPKKTYKI